MRVFYIHELLGGSDHEFVVNLYTRLLNRWPDEGGYKHYMARIQGEPERRRETAIEIGQSGEAKSLGVVLREESDEADPVGDSAAPQPGGASGDVAALMAEIAELRGRLGPGGGTEAQDALERAEAGIRRLRSEVDALHADVCRALRQALQDRLQTR